MGVARCRSNCVISVDMCAVQMKCYRVLVDVMLVWTREWGVYTEDCTVLAKGALGSWMRWRAKELCVVSGHCVRMLRTDSFPPRVSNP